MEFENILRRNIGYPAILMIVPTIRLKAQIETIIGRREQRLTLMTVRELHTKFESYYSDLLVGSSKEKNE